MSQKNFLLYSAFILLLASVAIKVQSKEGGLVGTIGSVNKSKKEIIVNLKGDRSIEMGTEVYVRIGDDVAVMEVTFPMMSTSKCRLLKRSSGYLNKIGKGMQVYRYDKSVIAEKNETSDNKFVYKAGSVKKIGGMDFVSIPGGTFVMGSYPGEKDKRPGEDQHQVTVSPFLIGKYEVTQKQYEEIMGANPSEFKAVNNPVHYICWDDAVEFCKRFSKKFKVKARLPYEAEWEFAYRAGTNSRYYWGDEVNEDYCWYKINAGGRTHPVGTKKPNAFGLFDMSGNVWECCVDFYQENYYSVSPQLNPAGPASGKDRVWRGGTWNGMEHLLRASYRNYNSPDTRHNTYGMRVVIVP